MTTAPTAAPSETVEVEPTTAPTPTEADTPAPEPTATSEGDETPGRGDIELIGTSWSLVSMGPSGEETPVIEGTTVTLTFESPTQLVGSGGCNSYGGDYTVQNGTLQVGEIVSTEIGCTGEGVMEQEQRYFEALRSAESLSTTDEGLTIFYEEGQSALNFVPAEPSVEASLGK